MPGVAGQQRLAARLGSIVRHPGPSTPSSGQSDREPSCPRSSRVRSAPGRQELDAASGSRCRVRAASVPVRASDPARRSAPVGSVALVGGRCRTRPAASGRTCRLAAGTGPRSSTGRADLGAGRVAAAAPRCGPSRRSSSAIDAVGVRPPAGQRRLQLGQPGGSARRPSCAGRREPRRCRRRSSAEQHPGALAGGVVEVLDRRRDQLRVAAAACGSAATSCSTSSSRVLASSRCRRARLSSSKVRASPADSATRLTPYRASPGSASRLARMPAPASASPARRAAEPTRANRRAGGAGRSWPARPAGRSGRLWRGPRAAGPGEPGRPGGRAVPGGAWARLDVGVRSVAGRVRVQVEPGRLDGTGLGRLAARSTGSIGLARRGGVEHLRSAARCRVSGSGRPRRVRAPALGPPPGAGPRPARRAAAMSRCFARALGRAPARNAAPRDRSIATISSSRASSSSTEEPGDGPAPRRRRTALRPRPVRRACWPSSLHPCAVIAARRRHRARRDVRPYNDPRARSVTGLGPFTASSCSFAAPVTPDRLSSISGAVIGGPPAAAGRAGGPRGAAAP